MEYLDICDETGAPTGAVVARETAHREGILHRTAHVWIARKVPGGFEVLPQKRSLQKESYPGEYDTSSAGHIPAGEEPLPSALRELGEELGLHAREDQLAFAGSFRIQYEKVFHGRPFRDNEFTYVYVYRDSVDEAALTLQQSEVDGVRWFPLPWVLEEVRRGSDLVCAPIQGLTILSDYLNRKGE